MIVERRPVVAHIKATFGEWYDSVELNGKPLDPGPSLKIWNHSPDGFAWGYGGSGPAQLALAILLEVTGDRDLAVRYYQAFKNDIIAQQPRTPGWDITVHVWAWLNDQGAGLKVCPACEDIHFGRCIESLG